MTNKALRAATTMPEPRPADSFADYRAFRMTAMATSRLTVAGLFFIVWALLFAEGHRWETTIFLGSTTVLLLAISIVSAMVAYMLYKRRGGKIEKGPRTAQEMLSGSDPTRQSHGGQDVSGHKHEGGDDPKIP